MSPDLKEVTAAFAAYTLLVLTVALFTKFITPFLFSVDLGMVLSIYGAHNLFNDKFPDAGIR